MQGILSTRNFVLSNEMYGFGTGAVFVILSY
jgi:hypothetical protein